jgi:hypothetical protein
MRGWGLGIGRTDSFLSVRNDGYVGATLGVCPRMSIFGSLIEKEIHWK